MCLIGMRYYLILDIITYLITNNIQSHFAYLDNILLSCIFNLK